MLSIDVRTHAANLCILPSVNAKTQASHTSVDVRAQQSKTVDRKDGTGPRREAAILAPKTVFPRQQKSPAKRPNAYELPTNSPKTAGAPSSSTPQRLDKHVSSPPTQRANTPNSKPTLRAGAFQAARSRSNSTPRPSEWFTASTHAQNQPAAAQTRSEILQRPASRPQSVISTSPDDKRNSIRVSALPISQSRKSRALLEGLERSPQDKSQEPVARVPRPAIPQRSVSAHPKVFARSVKDKEKTSPGIQPVRQQDESMLVPTSGRMEPAKRSSMQMERAKSASGVETPPPAKAVRPRSLTLSAKNPAELDSIFQEFIVSLCAICCRNGV